MAKRREPDYSFDLHGWGADQAKLEAERRLREIRAGGVSCLVRIITGRGEHSPNGEPVIGDAVKEWLESEGRRTVNVSDVQWAPDRGSLLVQITIRKEGD